MSLPAPPSPAKLIVGMFMGDKGLAVPVVERLMARFGPVDLVSPWWPFDFTDYYADEMGVPLFRRMLAFQEWIDQGSLAEIKVTTNRIESGISRGAGSRVVNIDPGYLLPERFVLATGKNFTHRIYIGEGIYADLTLIYQKGKFQSLPWTYPDYADARIQSFLIQARKKYLADIQKDQPDG